MPPARTILFAEDEPSFRLAAFTFLSSQGYQVEVCESGKAAIEALTHSQFDVVILDYRMPEMTGLNVLQWMYEQKSETPVIMLTGAGSESIAVEALKLGAYDYILKDNLEFHHLPIVINGVYERYLFRREKKLREDYEHNRDNNRTTLKLFHSTLSSLSHILKNSLSLLALSLEEDFRPLLPAMSQEGQQHLETTIGEMRQQFELISSGIDSLLTLSHAIHEKLAGAKSYEDIQKDVSKSMSKLIEDHKNAMDS
jgi:DNA-binding response OmpR family regulator